MTILLFSFISKLVRALSFVNLAGCTLLHGPLKFKVLFLLPNCCVIYHHIFSTYDANNSLKLSFTLNCVLKRANDLKTISNRLVSLSTRFRNLKPFLMNGNRCRTRQTNNRDIINILLTSFSRSVLQVTDPRFSPSIYGPSAKEKTRSVTYSTALELG